MSVMKYTRKYLLYSLLGLVVICGVGAIVYSQIQRGRDMHGHYADFESGQHTHSSDMQRPSVWQKITANFKKKPKSPTGHSHDHDDSSYNDEYSIREIPRSLEERLNEVRIKYNGHYNHDYLTNPNYYRDVYEAVSDGRDMAATIQLLKEYGIYTHVVLDHMESYDAFIYVQNTANLDIQKPPAMKYAKRVVNEAPSSPQALEAWLYLERVTKDPQEDENYLHAALEYHPNSARLLSELGSRLIHEKPEQAISYLKRANRLDSKKGDRDLGIAYQRLGDYKTSWVHLRKAAELYPDSAITGTTWMLLEAIENGAPLISPIEREMPLDLTVEGTAVPSQHPVDVPSAPNSDMFVDGFVMPADMPAPPQVPDSSSPEDIARQDAEQEAFLEMLREQEAFARRLAEDAEFKSEYFKDVSDFINWAESIENDAPIDTNNFLAKEMERHLLGKKTRFAPDRLKRGFEFINKYGQDEGIKRLHQLDPDLAKQVKQQLNERRVSPLNPRDK